MKIEIKNRWNGNIIITGEYESVNEALQKNKHANLHGADLCAANLYDANLCGANLCGANLHRANLHGVDLCDADLCDANLCGANLCGANLHGADLHGADLCAANLYDANLCDANGITLPIINITGSSFHFFYMDGIIKIGCEHWPVDHWIENYELIGHKHNFTSDQIAEYGGYIKMIENLIKEKK